MEAFFTFVTPEDGHVPVVEKTKPQSGMVTLFPKEESEIIRFKRNEKGNVVLISEY